jgi:hypothetical protein
MLPADAMIISVDDHAIEHPRVWLDRLPAKYADVAPRIVRLPDGNDTRLYERARVKSLAPLPHFRRPRPSGHRPRPAAGRGLTLKTANRSPRQTGTGRTR